MHVEGVTMCTLKFILLVARVIDHPNRLWTWHLTNPGGALRMAAASFWLSMSTWHTGMDGGGWDEGRDAGKDRGGGGGGGLAQMQRGCWGWQRRLRRRCNRLTSPRCHLHRVSSWIYPDCLCARHFPSGGEGASDKRRQRQYELREGTTGSC